MGQTKNQKLSWTCFIYTKDAIRIQYFLKGRFVYYPGSALKRHIPRPHSETRRQKLWWCSWEIWFSSQVSMVLGLVKVWEPQSFGWFEVNQIWQQRFLQKCIYCITYHPVTHIGGLPTHSDHLGVCFNHRCLGPSLWVQYIWNLTMGPGPEHSWNSPGDSNVQRGWDSQTLNTPAKGEVRALRPAQLENRFQTSVGEKTGKDLVRGFKLFLWDGDGRRSCCSQQRFTALACLLGSSWVFSLDPETW